MEFVVYALFVLLEPITVPPVLALEAASAWLDSHPLAAWSAGILALCAWFVAALWPGD